MTILSDERVPLVVIIFCNPAHAFLFLFSPSFSTHPPPRYIRSSSYFLNLVLQGHFALRPLTALPCIAVVCRLFRDLMRIILDLICINNVLWTAHAASIK